MWTLLASVLPGNVRAQTQAAVFSQAEIDQMLAPIALFPDELLSQVLIAATYPLEVVEAARWVAANPRLSGADAVRAAASQGWDPSVQALVAFPDLLQRMDDDLDWTRRLGDAWLIQEAVVSDRIQHLRHRADAAGHLRTTEQVRTRRDSNIIIIEQANPQVVYVPYYQPTVVYGSWWHASHPPVYWAPPRGYHSGAVFYFGPGIRLYSGFFYSRFDWPRRQIVVVNHHHHHHHHGHRRPPARGGYARWQHNPQHRRGVAYRTPQLNRDFSRHGASINANRRPVWERDEPGRQGSREQRRTPGRWQGDAATSQRQRPRSETPTRSIRSPDVGRRPESGPGSNRDNDARRDTRRTDAERGARDRSPGVDRQRRTETQTLTRPPAQQPRPAVERPSRGARDVTRETREVTREPAAQDRQRGRAERSGPSSRQSSRQPPRQAGEARGERRMQAPNAPSRADTWQPRGRSARE
ncbi:MAG: DUF3300 domain-containing protein [Alcanivorax sp.]|nr:DUF3300 domain-containing protein [Alcanivorax sp.]